MESYLFIPIQQLIENTKYQTMKLATVLDSHEVVKKRLDDTRKTLERQM